MLQSATLLCHFKEGSDDFNQNYAITGISYYKRQDLLFSNTKQR